MAYFIFTKNVSNQLGTIANIAENESDFNALNITSEQYKIIQDSVENFNAVKYGTKIISGYTNDVINYVDVVFGENYSFSKENIQDYINTLKSRIKLFTDANPNHSLFTQWSNYSNQLDALDLDSISWPLQKSLEQHLNDIGQTTFHPLQIP
jgi:hypothetical protein